MKRLTSMSHRVFSVDWREIQQTGKKGKAQSASTLKREKKHCYLSISSHWLVPIHVGLAVTHIDKCKVFRHTLQRKRCRGTVKQKGERVSVITFEEQWLSGWLGVAMETKHTGNTGCCGNPFCKVDTIPLPSCPYLERGRFASVPSRPHPPASWTWPGWGTHPPQCIRDLSVEAIWITQSHSAVHATARQKVLGAEKLHEPCLAKSCRILRPFLRSRTSWGFATSEIIPGGSRHRITAILERLNAKHLGHTVCAGFPWISSVFSTKVFFLTVFIGKKSEPKQIIPITSAFILVSNLIQNKEIVLLAAYSLGSVSRWLHSLLFDLFAIRMPTGEIFWMYWLIWILLFVGKGIYWLSECQKYPEFDSSSPKAFEWRTEGATWKTVSCATQVQP